MIPLAAPDVTEAEMTAVNECLKSGWLTTGPKVKAFEEAFAEFVGASQALAVNSATQASLLVFQALKETTERRKIIFPVCTFSGPPMMAWHLGFDVVLVDTAPRSRQIDLKDVAAAMSSDVAAVCPTHMAGDPCDLYNLKALCQEYGAWLIDDAAHAFPARLGKKFIGGDGLADATFFSFYATKPLTTGEGGMVTTSSTDLAEGVRKARSHGFSADAFDRYTGPAAGWAYDVAGPGWKANMPDTAAAMGLVQLQRTPAMRSRRREIACAYDRAFEELPGITTPDETGPVDRTHAHHLYQIGVACERDAFIAAMARRSVKCSVHFIPLHRHGFWCSIVGPESFPRADAMFRKSVSLPLYSAMSDQDTETVIDAVRQAIEEPSP